MNTEDMKNVENAFAKGGAAATHQPGGAQGEGTTTTSTSKETPSTTGMGTQSHEEKFGDQYQQPGILGQMFTKAVSGSKTGTNGMNTGMGEEVTRVGGR